MMHGLNAGMIPEIPRRGAARGTRSGACLPRRRFAAMTGAAR